ncbi:S1 RNA-binding domain-containing protein [Streptomyces sp. NPDC006992]|uniref:S1 RNA-binding domain-containing protein n=1 Tax=unclassified Streptomyces TaxID=2593676 RepID=UPI0033F7E42E
MQLPYVHRLSPHDPADHDEHGHRTGSTDSADEHGIEEALLQAVAAFAEATGVDRLAVREPRVPCLAHLGAEPPVDGFGPDGRFPLGPAGPDGLPDGFHDGAEVPLDVALELVRTMLRDNGAWCRLEREGSFAVHVGWDRCLYVGTALPCAEAVTHARALGLFPELRDRSPYAMETGTGGIQRPGDDDFWATVRWAVATRGAGLLEEAHVEGAARWHRLTGDSVEKVRARLAPRARLALWPDLSPDIDAVLGGLPSEGLVEGVWQEADGRIHSAVADEDAFPELAARISRAVAAALLPVYTDERVPLFTAVLPDSDGIVRARWRTDPTPGDRNWALLRTLRRGETVTGTVSLAADFGVTFVDIGGFDATINIPELSWRHVDHPSDVVSVGQQIEAEILVVDPVREQVCLSLKALRKDPMVPLRAQVGRTLAGPVTRVVPFGVFVRVEEAENGYEGLVHHSELSDSAPQPAPREGDTLLVKILDVDPVTRRIALSQRQAAPHPDP